MSRLVVTIEWVVLYSFSSLLLAGILINLLGDEATRPRWVDGVILLSLFVGFVLVIWQGAVGHLPATGFARIMPFLSRFFAWSLGLAVVVGAVGALIGYLCAWNEWSNRDFAIGMIIFPGMAGGFLGFAAGAIISIVKAVKSA
jgi:hypothetical protein